MTILSTHLPSMRATAESTFNDTCSIHVPTISQNSLGDQTKTWTNTNNIACGFAYGNATTNYRGQVVTLDEDAILRLPLTQGLDDKSEITVRGNRYSINGINTGLTVKIVSLKRVVADE